MAKCTDLTGKRFGKLIVKSFSNFNKHHQSQWNCLCDCGNSKVIARNALVCGLTVSCSCYHDSFRKLKPFEAVHNYLIKFNQTHKTVTITYEDFVEFTKIKECHYCKNVIPWKEYQKSGSSKNTSYYLDRKDNNLGYTKENCVVCCPRCNKGKGFMFTYDQWYKMTEPFRTGELL